MITTVRTPLRVSFFGGGTDYPEFFERRHGAVVGMAIDKYIYISAVRLTSILGYRYRVAYSRLEMVNEIAEIEHPVVRSVLRMSGLDEPLDISIVSDVPANTGLGSSSTFTVGFLRLVCELRGQVMTKSELARTAIYVERECLSELVGVQDQHFAAFGGINRFDFTKGRTRISPVQLGSDMLKLLTESMVLVYTGIRRNAASVLDEQISKTRTFATDAELEAMLELVDRAVTMLESSPADSVLRDFGALLHEGWVLKKRLSAKISSGVIDEIYERGMRYGALGGKLNGAGAGGFLLFLVPRDAQAAFIEAMAPLSCLPVGLDVTGPRVISS